MHDETVEGGTGVLEQRHLFVGGQIHAAQAAAEIVEQIELRAAVADPHQPQAPLLEAMNL